MAKRREDSSLGGGLGPFNSRSPDPLQMRVENIGECSAKDDINIDCVTARQKPCPFKARFSATCEAVSWREAVWPPGLKPRRIEAPDSPR